jgi:hypothetical protein
VLEYYTPILVHSIPPLLFSCISQRPSQPSFSFFSLFPSPSSLIMSANIQVRQASSKQSLTSTDVPRPSSQPHTPTSTLASLYVVSGLPKSPHTWNLADSDTTLGVHHSEGAVGRFWRAEVLGHTVSAGVGGKKKKRGGGTEVRGAGALGKQEIGKMLSKTLKVVKTSQL